MNKFLIAMALPAIMGSCMPKTVQQPHQTRTEPTIVAHALDFSKSTKTPSYFDATDAEALYLTLCPRTPSTIKFFGVYAQSALQDIRTFHVLPAPDTASLDGETNIYQRAKIAARNRRLQETFSIQAHREIAKYASAINQPHTEPYTNLSGTLSLIEQTLHQEIYKSGYKKYVLLCTDMVNDPQNAPRKKLAPVHLPGTKVLVVRSVLSLENLQRIFPDSEVYCFTSAQDAITFISQQ